VQPINSLAAYSAATRRIAAELTIVRDDIEKWIERNSDDIVSVRELALLEAHHTQRVNLGAELLAIETSYMEHLLDQLKKAHLKES
jgi:hypothetical protein